MTDLTARTQPASPTQDRKALRDVVAANIARRHGKEMRFRAFGMAMVGVAILSAALLVLSIILQSVPALTENRLHLRVDVTAEKADPAGNRDPLEIRARGDFTGLVQDSLIKRFPSAEADGQIDDLFDLFTSVAAVPLAKVIAADPSIIGKTHDVSIPINDDLDLFLKGAYGKPVEMKGQGRLQISPTGVGQWTLTGQGNFFQAPVEALRRALTVQADALEAQNKLKAGRLNTLKAQAASIATQVETARAAGSGGLVALEAALETASTNVANLETELAIERDTIATYRASAAGQGGPLPLSDDKPSVLIEAGGGTFKLTSLSPTTATASTLIRPTRLADVEGWQTVLLTTAQTGRPVSDATIAFGRALTASDNIKPSLNTTIFTNSDSNDAELAGLLSALVGTILTLAVTFCLAVPIGVATAVYLEEFAPKNALTDFIEVNINNLAAVPSIVFGLLGFAVFLTFFGMPRSAPIVGGIVLTLMSLPVIIIASRAALKAVPPSIREAALGVGASKMQTVFHHVLPLAMPGIMTGSILAMAHALGETAPLLMIGMVAFIADVPQSLTDSATVLPVELFMWAGRPERAWEPRTALAIIILLIVMVLMNALAIFLRRKFERRW
jgi:phosphate transport system permease protein